MNKKEIDEVSTMFCQVIRNQKSILHRRLEEEGFCRAQPWIIHILSHCDGATQVEIAHKLDVTPATISAMLKRMERDGIIERCRSETDHRVTHVYLTEKGRNQTKIVNQIFNEIFMKSFGNFSQEELAVAKTIFSKLIVNFNN